MASFTNFCCRSSGSNLNAGTRTGSITVPGTGADLTYASGSWVQSTGVFTVASGDPVADGVAVGDFASVYADGSTVTGFIGRVTARTTTTITVSLTAKSGTAPTNGSSSRTLKIGGAWLGPNAAEAFPFNFVQNTMTNSAGDAVRINMMNDATYSITTTITHSNAGIIEFRGYTTTYEDGGMLTLDGGTSGASYTLLNVTNTNIIISDFIMTHNGATGNAAGLSFSSAAGGSMIRNGIIHDIRGSGVSISSNVSVEKMEMYACGLNNTANDAGISCSVNTFVKIKKSILHDNAGSNIHGLRVHTSCNAFVEETVFDTNGANGIIVDTGGTGLFLNHCDFFGNGADGIKLNNSNAAPVYISNSNFVDNVGWGINGSGSGNRFGHITNNGFGAGTRENGSGQTTGLKLIIEENAVTYPNDVTPWVDPASGDFRINLTEAENAGDGIFPAGYPSTVGYPDIGAASHQDSGGGLFVVRRGGTVMRM